MVHRREACQIFFRQPEQTHCGRQTPAVLGVRRIFKSFLKMNERTCSLDQPFEKIPVTRIGVQPKLLEYIMRLVVAQFIPTTEKRDIKRMLSKVSAESRVR